VSKKKILISLSEALVTETANVSRISKSLEATHATSAALREAYAEMEQERDLYRLAFSLAVGRLSAHFPNSESPFLLESLLKEATEEVQVRSER
jgi:hypothetical protein